jgi:hypothetical protein
MFVVDLFGRIVKSRGRATARALARRSFAALGPACSRAVTASRSGATPPSCSTALAVVGVCAVPQRRHYRGGRLFGSVSVGIAVDVTLSHLLHNPALAEAREFTKPPA